MTAYYRSRAVILAASILFLAAGIWSVHHLLQVSDVLNGKRASGYPFVYLFMFGVLVWQNSLAYLERPYKVTPRQWRIVSSMRVVGIVPAYNEDPEALRACINSMLHQSVKPYAVVVVDDGSKPEVAEQYEVVISEFEQTAQEQGVKAYWIRQSNNGKRHAQIAAVNVTPEADAYWTVDSDTISDSEALAELVKPMADPDVQSVAGIVMAANVRVQKNGKWKSNFLTRFTDLWFVVGQLTDRSALSTLKSVWVNSGPIALYRADVIRDNVEGYLSETFNGEQMQMSDDSLLTLYSMMRGKTVQQPTALCFTLMPESVSHHLRQYYRWMRGSFIRSLWRMRYLSLGKVAYWLHLTRWIQMGVASVVFVIIMSTASIKYDLVTAETLFWIAAFPICVGYAQALRYMLIKRSDQPILYQWCTWLLAPVAVFWALIVLRAVRWYSIFTVAKKNRKWGTREKVEVMMTPQESNV